MRVAPTTGTGYEQCFGVLGWCSQRGDEQVAGVIVDREVGAPERDLDADPGAGVALVGQGGQAGYGGRVERGQDMGAGAGDVVRGGGLDRRGPQGGTRSGR